MNIRVIGGEFGGRLLDAPAGRRMHPMGERIRNALFNSIGSEVQGARVLDAFAGTGAVGLEALSRGASHVTFIERDKLLQKILAGNIERLGVENRTLLVRSSVANWIETVSAQQFDIILVDPPYHDTQFSTVERLLDLLKPGALMVLSHPGKGEVPTKTGVVVVDNRSYGNADLTFYRRRDV
jgi:16S rRNA (guanine966-N2)-methyltransferase